VNIGTFLLSFLFFTNVAIKVIIYQGGAYGNFKN